MEKMSKSFFNDYYEQDMPFELAKFYKVYPKGLKNGKNQIYTFQKAMAKNEELTLEDEFQFFLGFAGQNLIVYDMSDYTIMIRDPKDSDIVEENFRSFEELVDWIMY